MKVTKIVRTAPVKDYVSKNRQPLKTKVVPLDPPPVEKDEGLGAFVVGLGVAIMGVYLFMLIA